MPWAWDKSLIVCQICSKRGMGEKHMIHVVIEILSKYLADIVACWWIVTVQNIQEKIGRGH